ncbi:M28 family peptidase [Zooshikella marina]|nr:M28 family peptidase [Zooshikella ganghwensis]
MEDIMRKKLLPAMIAILGGTSGLATADTSTTAAMCDQTINRMPWQLMECVNAYGVKQHLQMFQTIADANGGTRASGTSGYDQSIDYVVNLMSSAGYDVKVQPFAFTSFEKLGASTMVQTAPDSKDYKEDTDFKVMTHSEPGNVTAPVAPVDIHLGPNNNSTSGCEEEDFDNFPAGSIALIQRGACAFGLKAENAAAAGAVGVIIFNQGNTEDRKGLMSGTLGSSYSGGIPVMFTTYDVGESLVHARSPQLQMLANVKRIATETYNVIAESKGGNPNNVVMVGSHLDSVDEGPGINDNGSGSAGILEIALKMQYLMPKNKLRFAWWGAEESGLVGSTHYVQNLTEEEKDKIALYLNFDMIGSPNYFNGIYDGDGSSFGLEGPPGSDVIEHTFERFFNLFGQPYRGTEISFRSDYAEFFNEGIAFGGLFTGAEGIKTEEEARRFGGEAGKAYDHCYHQACDDITNINDRALDINVDAAAFTTLIFAYSTKSLENTTIQPPLRANNMRRTVPAKKIEPERWGNDWIK